MSAEVQSNGNRHERRTRLSWEKRMGRKLRRIGLLADRMDESPSDLFVTWAVERELTERKRIKLSRVKRRNARARAARIARRRSR